MRARELILTTAVVSAWACGSETRVDWSARSSGTTAEFRGLSAACPATVWASGRNGTYTRSTDGGATWTTDSVPGASELFFIDVHAVDGNTAYLLGTHFDGGLARFYKTNNGGADWILQHEERGPGVFFDGLAFWDESNGVAFSDPVGEAADRSFLIVITDNGGATWRRVPPENIPPPLPGEAGFAASGTAISVQGSDNVWFGTGGAAYGRVFRSSDRGRHWTVAETPITANSTSGIFGVAFWDAENGVAVGGDYTAPSDTTLNIARTRDGGVTWELVASSQPAGVRWGVTQTSLGGEPILIAVGPSGWGFSEDRGVTWVPGDTLGHNTATRACRSGAAWLGGVEGRLTRVYWDRG